MRCLRVSELCRTATRPGNRAANRSVKLRRQADLGNEDEARLAARERVLRRLDVDFGLAAAGNAMQQDRARILGLLDGIERRQLIGRELERRGGLRIGFRLGAGSKRSRCFCVMPGGSADFSTSPSGAR